ncbi:uncharacterized protein LOC116346374 [Contarinia nasturtii]|uniref:uncharacterized protein LOC116346374 n=1 Tax=Contarinia nasturtii TaxID=265458 RepID=UPI0012D4707D|nr:uncharacterized protein LOC116346374 [Contarinia nasturtii]
MDKATGRFNLRARKSLKLTGQIECISCKRHYFPSSFSEDDEDTEQKENLCCNCENEMRKVPQPKKRTPRTSIKVEKIDADFNIARTSSNVSHDQHQNYGQTTNTQISKNNMVQIHSIDLIQQHPTIKSSPNAFKQTNLKQEKLNATDEAAMMIAEANRSNENQINKMEACEGPEFEKENEYAVLTNEITKNDTVESLKIKFPNVNPFEFEFLLFLKAQKSTE